MCNSANHSYPKYTVIGLDECLPMAKGFQRDGKKWHSHVLSPGCHFNPYPDQYAAVVEDDDAHIAYIAVSDGFPDVDKQLVRMLHGDDILDSGHPSSAESELVGQSPLLSRLIEIDQSSQLWHHHMNFPDCALNPQRGHWAITIETAGEQFSESYENEPRDILRAIEVRYFSNLKA